MNPRSAARRFATALGLLATLVVPARTRADTVLSVPTTADGEVTIKLSTPLAQPPRFGFLPVRVAIDNAAAQDRSWSLEFESGTRGRLPGVLTTTMALAVPANQSREFWVYVPLADAGEPSAAPSLGATGITPSPTAAARPSPFGRVSITKTGNVTHITRTLGASRPFAREETTIDETTGEMIRQMVPLATGAASSYNRTTPPAGSDVTYTIDPATGFVRTHFSRGVSGATKVTVVTAAGAMPTPVAPVAPPTVTITKTPTGTKVLRARVERGGTTLEETEINATTGAITAIRVQPDGTMTPIRSTPPAAPGTEVTHTIDPNTGGIQTMTRLARSRTDPAKVNIVTAVTPPAASPRSGAPRFLPQPNVGMPLVVAAQVSGPGVAAMNRVQFPSLSGDAGMRPMAASPELARLLEQGLNAEGVRTPNLSAIELARTPADWRFWSGFATVVLAADEYAGCDAGRRAALLAWVGLGGRLVLVPAAERTPAYGTYGAGSIITAGRPLTTAPTAADLAALRLSLGGGPGHPDRDALQVLKDSELGRPIEHGNPSMLWVGLFLVAFAVTVGPVNLFVLAPAKKRHRMFLTTPVIALVTVAGLMLTILMQDGIGGRGVRRSLVVFLPGENQAAVFQEQAARTGFLPKQTFPLADDTQLTVLPFPDEPFNGYTPFTPELTRADGRAGGSWFRSRERQAQLLQRVVPTRGRVEQVGTSSEGAPILQSSIAVPLRDFVCIGADGDVWTAANVPPGQRITLARGGAWITQQRLGGSRRMNELLGAAAPQNPGVWGARSGPGELAPIPTLASIRWAETEVVMTGVLEQPTKTEAAR